METTTTQSLIFTRSDLSEVISTQERIGRTMGYHLVPKLGQYNDELFAVCAELKRRGVR